MRRTTLSVIVAASLLAAAPRPAQAQRRGKPKVDVGVVVDGNPIHVKSLLDAIEKQVIKLVGDGVEVSFADDKLLSGDFDAAKIKGALDQLLADPEIELVYALGMLASADASRRPRLAKPVIAPLVIDRKIQGMPFEKGASGRANLSYIDWSWSVERDLELFKEVTGCERVVFVASEYLAAALPGVRVRAAATAKRLGIELTVVGVSGSVEQALAALPDDTTAVYIGPLEEFSPAANQRFVASLNKRKIATFAMKGEVLVRAGALVGRHASDTMDRIARRVAVNTQRIIAGDDPKTFSVALRVPERLMINLATARAIGLSPSWAVLTEAQLLHAEREGQLRKVSLTSVMKEALAGNVNIKALEQAVVAGRASVRGARANLLPQIDTSSSARMIDRDRAAAASGNAPRYLWNGDVTINQLLWSERARAGFSVEKHAQRAREHELAQSRWDVVAEVGKAYLGVLRAKTAERIQRNTLKLSRTNHELAVTRLDAGVSSKADVYRWEAQVASERKRLIEVVASRNLAEIDLQRILHRPVEESFATAEGDLTAPGALDSQESLVKFIGDPATFRRFRRFMVEEAVRRAPELTRLDAAIAAQKRLHKSARRSIFSPTLMLSTGATQRFYKGGEGSDPSPLASPSNGLDWFVSLNVALPLYSGGARYAEIDRVGAEVARLTREREGIYDRVAQRVVSAMHLMGASYAGLRLSRLSAEASRKNYELVAVAYAQGAVRIVDLLDAQNAWVTADQVTADAAYNILIDAVEVQRAAGHFTMLMGDADRDALLERAASYIAAGKK